MRIEHDERSEFIRNLPACRKNREYGGGNMTKLTTSVGDYRAVEIPPDSVIYADPPYKNTKDYIVDFDHEAFYDWCEKQEQLVLISEYWMPEDRFVCIAEFPRTSTMSATNNSKKEIEKVFVPNHQYEKYKRMMNVQLDLFDNNLRANRAISDGSE